MNQEVEKLCAALDAFATQVTNTWGSDATLVEGIGWHSPALTRHDLAAFPRLLARDLRNAAPESLDEDQLLLVKDLPRRLQLLQGNTLPQMFGGNSPQAVPAYVSSFVGVRELLSSLLNWQVISDPKAMPGSLARRVRSVAAELDQLAPKKEQLESQIQDIRKAHAAAESLPLDLQALDEARKKLAEVLEFSKSKAEETSKHSYQSYLDSEAVSDRAKEIEDTLTKTQAKVDAIMKGHSTEAEAVLKQCEEAYRASTSRGLAAAFDQRAKALGWSMTAWTVGLIAALALGAFFGIERVQTLTAALAAPEPRWGVIAMHTLLSLATVGAPVWFAWLSTKQIGQRFRLAEDYSFKAAVARAYEGYRKEASRIDSAFESRLFDSALTRLEEAPLRLVEASSHGSPWHELVGSEAFKKAVDVVPELRDKLAEISSQAISAFARKPPAAPATPATPQEPK